MQKTFAVQIRLKNLDVPWRQGGDQRRDGMHGAPFALRLEKLSASRRQFAMSEVIKPLQAETILLIINRRKRESFRWVVKEGNGVGYSRTSKQIRHLARVLHTNLFERLSNAALNPNHRAGSAARIQCGVHNRAKRPFCDVGYHEHDQRLN